MQMRRLAHGLSLTALVLGFGLASAAGAVTIDWVTVGNPGNAADADTGFGAVADVYRIAETAVTNAQYAEFLNAVAATDTFGLYNTNMDSSSFGGIARSGSSGDFSYSAKAGREQMPVNFVSFYDSLRFANWLHNGQLTGAQDATTTEDGAYTITAQGISDNSITRNAGATIFLPSEDEWYKAAYHNALGLQATDYFDYPAGFDAQTSCTAPGATANTANCGQAVGDLTDVGSYTGSASPYGTFDQGGNVFEWNEAIISGSRRGIRGGSFSDFADDLAASARLDGGPTLEGSSVGFRVASIPEPGTGLLLMLGMLGIASWRRRSA
jgi:formylglycine-generating enzyme